MNNIHILAVKKEEKEILRNLLEKYDYEFSFYDKRDVNHLGLFGYDYLDYYWTEKGRFPFFIKAGDKLAGFIMVTDYCEVVETDFTLSEFFILHKYRRLGIGKYAAFTMFDRFHGSWQLMYHPENITSARFWKAVVEEYTKGNFEHVKKCNHEYEDGTKGNLFIFNS